MSQITINLASSPLQGFSKDINPFEPRRRNLFVWYIQGPGSILGKMDEEVQRAIFYARTSTIPGVDIPAVEDHFITARWYVPGGKWEFGEISVEFLFSYPHGGNNDMYTVFYEWVRKVVNWNAPFAAAKTGEYESTGFVILLDPHLTISKVYQLVRCWPRAIGNIDLGYDTGDILRVPVTFRYDRVILIDKK